jgi:hypothetical protein
LCSKTPIIIEEKTKGRSNAFKLIGKRYLKVSYKKVSEEILVISVVDKGRDFDGAEKKRKITGNRKQETG